LAAAAEPHVDSLQLRETSGPRVLSPFPRVHQSLPGPAHPVPCAFLPRGWVEPQHTACRLQTQHNTTQHTLLLAYGAAGNGVWCEGRKEDWFCMHIQGGGPLEQLQLLHLFFTCLLYCVTPPPTHTHAQFEPLLACWECICYLPVTHTVCRQHKHPGCLTETKPTAQGCLLLVGMILVPFRHTAHVVSATALQSFLARS